MTEREYEKLVGQMSPRSPLWRDCLNAFWIGGLICVLGQAIMNGYLALGLNKENAGTSMSMTLVALSALLTGLSLYDDIAKHAGAGTLVPITGFANSIAAPAVEFQTEGFVLGVGAKMFTIAGPVIVYGLAASIESGRSGEPMYPDIFLRDRLYLCGYMPIKTAPAASIHRTHYHIRRRDIAHIARRIPRWFRHRTRINHSHRSDTWR